MVAGFTHEEKFDLDTTSMISGSSSKKPILQWGWPGSTCQRYEGFAIRVKTTDFQEPLVKRWLQSETASDGTIYTAICFTQSEG
jgi:hypothetical protein